MAVFDEEVENEEDVIVVNDLVDVQPPHELDQTHGVLERVVWHELQKEA